MITLVLILSADKDQHIAWISAFYALSAAYNHGNTTFYIELVSR